MRKAKREMEKYQMLIGGQWRGSSSNDWFETINPYSGESWALIPNGTATDVDAAVQAAYAAFKHGTWATSKPSARGRLLCRLADIILEHADKLARLEVRDNGKLFAEMSGQVKYLAEWYRYYGGYCDKIEGTVIPSDKEQIFNFTRHEPLGVIACITPWNSPLLLLAWKLAPALAAGNTAVIKPSEYTSASTLAFARLFAEAGFPDGVVNVVTGFGASVGLPLVQHTLVAKIAFTGSDSTGQAIYAEAARQLKTVTLELGGKSPNIIFADANIDNAVNGAISGIFAASGQTCIAGSRLLLQRSIHDEVVDRIADFAASAIIGDPMQPSTQVGPVTTPDQFQKVMHYINIAQEEGATCRLGGHSIDSLPGGQFVAPTMFTGVHNKMRIAQEEVFGPVLAVIPFDDEEEAVAIANDSPYGLAAGVWTKDMALALRMSERLEAGTVWINTYKLFSVSTPFGGVKLSGTGREKGRLGILEYTSQKSFYWGMNESPMPWAAS